MAEQEEQSKLETLPEAEGMVDGFVSRHAEIIKQGREDLRFIIGLSTGALGFSVAFVSQIVPSPEFQWLLVFSWIALLVSILAGIETHRRFQMFGNVTSENIKQYLELATKGSFEKSLLIEVVANIIKGQKHEYTAEQLHERFEAEWKPEDVRRISKTLIKNSQSNKSLLREIIKLARIVDRTLKAASPAKVLRSARRSFFAIRYLYPVSLYSFYAGAVLIAFFAILNSM